MKTLTVCLFFLSITCIYSRNITSNGCKLLIKKYEGLRLHAYPDPGTHNSPYTIGYGHTGNVKLGTVITQTQADLYLINDLQRFNRHVDLNTPATINSRKFDALVSLSYNCGYVVRNNIKKFIYSNDNRKLKLSWLSYCHSGRTYLRGLYNRRVGEVNYAGL